MAATPDGRFGAGSSATALSVAGEDDEEEEEEGESSAQPRFLFAGLVQEPIKGFDILHEACRRLWQKRQDFELVATADPAGQFDDFTRFAA